MGNKTLDMLQRIASKASFENCTEETSDYVIELRKRGLAKALDCRGGLNDGWRDVRLTLAGDEELHRLQKESQPEVNKSENIVDDKSSIVNIGTINNSGNLQAGNNNVQNVSEIKSDKQIVVNNQKTDEQPKASRLKTFLLHPLTITVLGGIIVGFVMLLISKLF
jgi:hypothetical protein